jgi:hypothetical protein
MQNFLYCASQKENTSYHALVHRVDWHRMRHNVGHLSPWNVSGKISHRSVISAHLVMGVNIGIVTERIRCGISRDSSFQLSVYGANAHLPPFFYAGQNVLGDRAVIAGAYCRQKEGDDSNVTEKTRTGDPSR